MRICTRCGKNKPNGQFFKRKAKPSAHCKTCEIERIAAWRNSNKDKQATIERRSRLKSTYGISIEQYDQLLKQQNYRCAVCGKHQDDCINRLAVDHDHHSLELRGLLCPFCNHKVVGKHRRGGLLKAASDYLERENYTGWFAPPKKKKSRRKKRAR